MEAIQMRIIPKATKKFNQNFPRDLGKVLKNIKKILKAKTDIYTHELKRCATSIEDV